MTAGLPPSNAAWVFSPHPLFLAELARLLTGMPVNLFRLGTGLAFVPPPLPPTGCSVAILDACILPTSLEPLVAEIRAAAPPVRLLAITEERSEAMAIPLLRLGVKGILTYLEARCQIVPAMTAVARGGVWVRRKVLSTFLDGLLEGGRIPPLPNGPALSRREKEVLGSVLESLSNKEIASRLNISERTVKFHVSNLLTKFSVKRRADLILLSFQSAARAAAAGPSSERAPSASLPPPGQPS